jgi:hypothetical protein
MPNYLGARKGELDLRALQAAVSGAVCVGAGAGSGS